MHVVTTPIVNPQIMASRKRGEAVVVENENLETVVVIGKTEMVTHTREKTGVPSKPNHAGILQNTKHFHAS
jgi:hypothetical protein